MNDRSSGIISFRRSLRDGTGRAMLILNGDRSSTVLHDALLQACFVNEVYDRQCEDSREVYLHQLIIASGAPAFFYEALLNKVNEASDSLLGAPEEAQVGLAQIFAILCLMATEDERLNREDLYAFFDKAPKELAELCVWRLVQLDGVAGLIRGVRRIHDDIVADYHANGWLFDILVSTLAERDGAESAATELQKARVEVAALDQLMVLNEARPSQKISREVVNYDVFKRKLDETGRAWGGQDFTAVELLSAADDLLNEHDPGRLSAYLNIFRKRHFPLPAAKLLPLLHHENSRVAGQAARALSNLNANDVRKAAFLALHEGRMAQTVWLLKSNYRAGDFAIIETKLDNVTPDDDAIHALGRAVLNLAEHDPVAAAEADAVLVKFYLAGRCSLCRGSFVKLLAEADAIPDWMVQELPFDVNTDCASYVGQNSEQA